MSPDEIHLRIVQIVQSDSLKPSDYAIIKLGDDNEYGIPAGTYVLGRDNVWRLENYCCAMRKHYLIGIVGQRNDEPMPTEAVDFISQWEPSIVMNIGFCPFCGTKLDADQTLRG